MVKSHSRISLEDLDAFPMHLISEISATHARRVNDISTACPMLEDDLAAELIHYLRREVAVVGDVTKLDVVTVAIGNAAAEIRDLCAVRKSERPGIVPGVAIRVVLDLESDVSAIKGVLDDAVREIWNVLNIAANISGLIAIGTNVGIPLIDH